MRESIKIIVVFVVVKVIGLVWHNTQNKVNIFVLSLKITEKGQGSQISRQNNNKKVLAPPYHSLYHKTPVLLLSTYYDRLLATHIHLPPPTHHHHPLPFSKTTETSLIKQHDNIYANSPRLSGSVSQIRH